MSTTLTSLELLTRQWEQKAHCTAGPWVNVLSHLDPKYGGMSAAVPALSAAVYRSGVHRVALAGFCAANESYSPFTGSPIPVSHMPRGKAHWLGRDAGGRNFTELIESASGIHIHGLWEQSTFVAARTARIAGKPYIVSAHGMLQSWALRNKRFKKAVYAALIERSNLNRAACLHALTYAEVKDYRDFGLQNPIAVIPNGVEIPAQTDSEAFLSAFPHLRGQRLVLFMSRLHFKKGLDILCKAWKSAAKRWPDAHLVLAGPDFENTRASVEALVADSGMRHRVTFTGMLNSSLKWSALNAADCFVLPSYSEGLSVPVLEALGMGLPVIVTKQCNLPEVAQQECGWVISPAISELEAALGECLASSSSHREAMSVRGRRLVANSYSWRVVGEQMSELYTWIQGGQRPVHLELKLGGER